MQKQEGTTQEGTLVTYNDTKKVNNDTEKVNNDDEDNDIKTVIFLSELTDYYDKNEIKVILGITMKRSDDMNSIFLDIKFNGQTIKMAFFKGSLLYKKACDDFNRNIEDAFRLYSKFSSLTDLKASYLYALESLKKIDAKNKNLFQALLDDNQDEYDALSAQQIDNGEIISFEQAEKCVFLIKKMKECIQTIEASIKIACGFQSAGEQKLGIIMNQKPSEYFNKPQIFYKKDIVISMPKNALENLPSIRIIPNKALNKSGRALLKAISGDDANNVDKKMSSFIKQLSDCTKDNLKEYYKDIDAKNKIVHHFAAAQEDQKITGDMIDDMYKSYSELRKMYKDRGSEFDIAISNVSQHYRGFDNYYFTDSDFVKSAGELVVAGNNDHE